MPLLFDTGRMIQWKHRWRTDQTEFARRRILDSQCGQYRVVVSRSLFRPKRRKGDKGGLSNQVYAEVRLPPTGNANWFTWSIISRHVKAEPAKRACEKHCRQNEH